MISQKSFLFLAFLLPCILTECVDEITHFPGYSCLQKDSLGEGANGKIYLVQDPHNNKRVFKISASSTANRRERDMLQRLKGEKYITEIFDSKVTEDKVYLILQYGSRGTLEKLVNENDYLQKVKNCFVMLGKIFEGIRNIHKHSIVHADLKMSNIVVDEDFNPLIIDFGFAIPSGSMDNPKGTVEYIPPEYMQKISERKFHIMFEEQSDLFSFGVIVYSVMKFHKPIPLKQYSYYEMMTYPITFKKNDPADFVNICMGLLKPLSKRLLPSQVEAMFEETIKKEEWDVLGHEFSYTLQSFASDKERAEYDSKVMRYFWMFVGLLAGAFLVYVLVSMWKVFKLKKPGLFLEEDSKVEGSSEFAVESSENK